MDRKTAKAVMEMAQRLGAALNDAEPAIRSIPDEAERSAYLKAMAKLVADIWLEFQAPVVRQYPDLDPDDMSEEFDSESDDSLCQEDLDRIAKLTTGDLERIDLELLADCSPQWRKVARVVGTAISKLDPAFNELPLAYFVQRIAGLVSQGSLQAQGDLRYIRHSEIRLPS